ncbi:autotransporter assembly complex protein TamA [Cohaesibacter intestini]|uniref:autotransporter assembly complex protein TamA n=1 Tax=Cohaesibacter intestini TaxID=2211145 RepID=UPI000DEB3068|nr:autotransporter assembly complex family protein [Cohaesibacter intestini]
MPFGPKGNRLDSRCRAFAAVRSRLSAPALALLLASTGLSAPAQAFEFLGFNFGSEDKSAKEQDIPDPVSYQAAMAGIEGDRKAALKDASVLITKQEQPVSGTTGLLVRARSDQKRLIGALYQQGRYGGVVEIRVNGQPYEDVPLDADLQAHGPAQVEIKVQEGPEFRFAAPKASLSDGTPIALADYGIIEGKIALSEQVLEAEDAIVAHYRRAGYPLAKISQRQLEADHDRNLLDVSLEVETGPQARLGAAQISGSKSVDATFIRRQADVPEGTLYTPEAIQATAKRLRALGVFDSVIVKTADEVGPDGTVPVLIDVKERKMRTLGAGVTVGNTDGIGLETFWTHRNIFGRAETLRIEGGVARIGQNDFDQLDYDAAVLFAKPGVIGPASTFDAKLSVKIENPDAFHKRAISGEVGIRQQMSDELSGRIGINVEYARVKDSTSSQTSLLTALPMELSWDNRDNKLDPTEGFQVLLEAEPTISASDDVHFFKIGATATAYYALDEAKRFVLAGKIAAGSIIGANKSDIPADRRFYTGGGGSIRGYAFQAAGPRDAANKPSGGRSYALVSVEGRMRVTDTIGLAAFVDTGGSFNSTLPGKDGDYYTGVGAGIRYLTPVGPLRLDVAVPLKKIKGEPQYGVYLGLGQAF